MCLTYVFFHILGTAFEPKLEHSTSYNTFKLVGYWEPNGETNILLRSSAQNNFFYFLTNSLAYYLNTI
jgi:hypothetical protein